LSKVIEILRIFFIKKNNYLFPFTVKKKKRPTVGIGRKDLPKKEVLFFPFMPIF
jgi:hypothetical protein